MHMERRRFHWEGGRKWPTSIRRRDLAHVDY
jgi:hypothetical protein